MVSIEGFLKNNKILAIALLAYLIVFFVDREIFFVSLDSSWMYIKEMLEVLPAVLIFTGLLEVWVPRERIMKTFGSESGILGKIVSFFLGSVSAGPIYAGFPITQSLLRKGASVSNITIILSAWAVVKIPILIVEVQFLGLSFMLTRWALTLPTIIIIGYLVGKFVDKEEILSKIGEFDENIQKLADTLPGHNCGSCGYNDCTSYAKELAKGDAKLDRCKPGGGEVQEELQERLDEIDETRGQDGVRV